MARDSSLVGRTGGGKQEWLASPNLDVPYGICNFCIGKIFGVILFYL